MNRTLHVYPFVLASFQYSSKEELLEHILECDIVIYDITQNLDQIAEAMWVLDEIHSNFDKVTHQMVFILLSTVMTWAKSKPLDPVSFDLSLLSERAKRELTDCRMIQKFPSQKRIIEGGKRTPTFGST